MVERKDKKGACKRVDSTVREEEKKGRVMGVYIKNFEPQDGLYVIKDGVIRKYKGKGGTVRPYELVEVKEPHGRLIDADKIVKDLRHDVTVDQDMLDYEELTVVIRETTQADKDIKQNAAEIIESTPTVIEGSE